MTHHDAKSLMTPVRACADEGERENPSSSVMCHGRSGHGDKRDDRDTCPVCPGCAPLLARMDRLEALVSLARVEDDPFVPWQRAAEFLRMGTDGAKSHARRHGVLSPDGKRRGFYLSYVNLYRRSQGWPAVTAADVTPNLTPFAPLHG